jgi:aryl-alcohol dehydrogenase-like predicted oxidoreductase
MIQLDQRQLGKSDIVVLSLGIGVWSWGDSRFWGYGKGYLREDIRQVYKACLDAGINFFDTAEMYGGGEKDERDTSPCSKKCDRGEKMVTGMPIDARENARPKSTPGVRLI